jgi:hypothetical protein
VRRVLACCLCAAPLLSGIARSLPAPEVGPGESASRSAAGTGSPLPEATYGRILLDADSEPLPLATPEPIVDLLSSAEVVGSARLDLATRSDPILLQLEDGGMRVRAIFHTIDRSEAKVLLGDREVDRFRDSYHHQVAAWKLSRLLGMTTLPPTAIRKVDGKKGAATLWVEDARTWTNWLRHRQKLETVDDSIRESELRWELEREDMRVFDALIDNLDRHGSNILIDSRHRLWLVDHTRAFTAQKTLKQAEEIRRCSTGLWSHLRALTPREIRRELRGHLDSAAIEALIGRRRRIVRRLEERIERLGETAVLFRLASGHTDVP